MTIYTKLTARAIRALEPGQKITQNGIIVENTATGGITYRLDSMVDGVRIKRTIGRQEHGVSLQDAIAYLEIARTRAREERLDLPKGRKIAMSFETAAKCYIERLETEGGNTIDRKRRNLELHLTPALGSKPISKIRISELLTYRKQRKDAGAADATINRELAVVSHLMAKAVEWGWITSRPKIPRVKESGGRLLYLTQEECSRIMDAAKRDISPHIFPFTVISLQTSMRMSEVLSIKPEHIDLIRKRIFVPTAKAGRREQPITQALADFLKTHLESLPDDATWIFPNTGSSSGRLMTIRKAHRRVVEAAGLNPDEVIRHTFRHTAITHLVQAGVDLPTVQKVSGHKTLAMVARYAHANGKHIDNAMNHLEERIALPR